MSGNGDPDGPSKGEENSTANITPAKEDHPSKIVTASTLHKDDGDQNSPLTSTNRADSALNEEILAMEEDVEAVIEKKLNLDAEKAPDIDSELDFELKWDDDNEINAMSDEPVTVTHDHKINAININEEVSEPLVWETTDNQDLNNEQSIDNKTPLAIANQAKVTINDIFKLDTNLKIDLVTKSTDSETNSLDERLVYSDVDVPEIEDKELLDELDAHISKTDIITEDNMEETNPIVPDSLKGNSGADVTSQDLNSTEMEVDESTLIENVEKTQLNDTVSTITGDTSTYDVNMEHKLGNLDAMTEIPTQELIEDIDCGDMSEGEQYDEDLLLQNDTTVTEPEGTNILLKDTEKTTNEQSKPKKSEFNIVETSTDLEDKLLADTVEVAGAIPENTEIENEFVFEKDSTMLETEIRKLDEDIEIENKESHADIILEASDIESDFDMVTPSEIEEENVSASKENVKSNLDSEFDKVISIDDTAVDSSTLLKETKKPTIEDIEPSNTEPLNITEQNINTIVALESNDIAETEELAPKVDMAAKEVTTDLAKEEVDAKVDDFVDDTQQATKPDLLLETESNVNIGQSQLAPKKLDSAEGEDFIKEIPSTSKSNDLQLEAESINVSKNITEPKEVDFTNTILTTSKSDDSQSKESKTNIKDVEQPSTSNINQESTPDTEKPSTSNIDKESTPDTEKPSTSNIDKESTQDTEKPSTSNIDKESTPDTEKPSTSNIDKESTHDTEKLSTSNINQESNLDTEKPSTSNIDKESTPDTEKPSTSNIDKESTQDTEKPSTSNIDKESTPDTEKPSTSNIDKESTHDTEKPSTSNINQESNLDTEKPSTSNIDKESTLDTEKPSTSNINQELSDEDQETDTLGLLAESSRVMDDDDDQEQEQDDDDDDDDFDQDEESNQMAAEHSEDSNAPPETDTPQETGESNIEKELDVPETGSDEVAEPVVEESLEVNENEVEIAVNALIASNLEEESLDVQVSDTDVKLSSEDSNSSSKLRQLLTKKNDKDVSKEPAVKSPSKMKKLEISKPKNEYSIVDLEESSSEDDVQVVNKPAEDANVTSVNIPSSVEVMAAGGELSQLTQKEGEVVISVPKPPPHKPARLNTGEVSIKTTTVTEPLLIPEATVSLQDPKPSKVGLEIFNLDSDDDDRDKDCIKAQEEGKCINTFCTSDTTEPRMRADATAATYYGAKGAVCMPCAIAVQERTQGLIEGVKDFSPLLSLDMGQMREELVEISDSESEEEVEVAKKPEDAIGDLTAKFLEENLEDIFNSTWLKYNMDERLQTAQKQIEIEVRQFEEDCKEIDAMLSECQVETDKLRRELYDTFAHERKELPGIVIVDTPTTTWSGLEEGILAAPEKPEPPTRQSKRRLQAAAEPPAKKPAIPLGYTPLDDSKTKVQDIKITTDIPIQPEDDNADISVVKLSAESAPAGLPPAGAARRPPLRPAMPVYAMRNAFGAWSRARVADVLPRPPGSQFTMCRVKFEHKVKNPCKVLPGRCLAYEQPSEVRMTIGTRVIALFADTQSSTKSYYSGIIAEIPNPVNNYRYLVFFDDGYAQYVQHQHTRLVCECAPLVWDEVHPFSRQFVRDYLRAYPERPMVRAHAGQSLKTEWNGKWWVAKVLKVDASLVQVHFEEDNRTEWIYRGSTRLAPLYLELQAAERQRARPLPRAAPGRRVNMPYVEYTRSDEPAAPPAPVQNEQELRRQRAVAKKSTAAPQPAPAAPLDGVSSRVVFYTPKNAIRPLKMVPHTCSPRCRRTDVLALKDLRTYNPLTKPLLSGWERQIVKYRFTKSVMYRAPCGRRVRDLRELHRYLQAVASDMGVDLFDFNVHTHCLAEFVLNKCLVSKKDLSHGKENVPVPCVNYYDSSLPEFCSYNTERTPTAGVPLNLDPEFLCGCDCTDDCADKLKCACWKMTLEGARTIGLDTDDVGYVYKRLPEPLPSGIYECNVRCKCRQTCLNRVAQHPLQLKLQVFKTLNRGWGIRALNDVPKGAFLCVYAGNLLTDATANLDGLNEGDEYLAELDYIEVVEQMKEGFEEDIPEADKKLDKEEESSTSSSEEEPARPGEEDDDFRPDDKKLLRSHVSEYSKRLRKRDKTKKKEKEDKQKQKDKEGSGEDCITISDDEELREPSRFAAQAGMGGSEFISKYKSVRAHFGKDEACYIMDAKVQGNIGRYLNHSCTPNVFVQNVFVDTHDPRFPWVAFFALAHIRAGTELTWNYNYDVGSVPGKILYCHCAAPNCRGRLL